MIVATISVASALFVAGKFTFLLAGVSGLCMDIRFMCMGYFVAATCVGAGIYMGALTAQ